MIIDSASTESGVGAKTQDGGTPWEVCPQCGSDELSEYLHESSWTAPECTYMQCDLCGTQWGHG